MATVSSDWALTIDRLSYLFALFVVPSFFLLLIEAARDEKMPFKIPRVLIIGMVFFALITFTPLLIENVQTKPTFKEEPGVLYPFFAIYFLTWISLGLAQMYKAFKASSGFKRNQLKYFLLAILIGFVAATNYFMGMFFPSTPPLFYPIEMIYTLTIAYAVIRFRLMDFNLMVRWGLAMGMLLVVAGGIFAGTMLATESISNHFNTTRGLPSLIGVLVLVMIYEPLRRDIISKIDHFIYQSPDFKELLQEIEGCIKNSSNLVTFAEALSGKLKNIWKVEHAGMVVFNPEKAEYEAHPNKEFAGHTIQKMGFPITSVDFLVKTLETERRLFNYGVILEDEVTILGKRALPGERTTFWKMKRTMQWLGATACVPIMNKEQLIGFFVLGNKKSGDLYNREDKKLLAHVSEMVAKPTMDMLYKPA